MRITVNPEAQASGDFGYAAPGEYTLRVAEVKHMMKEGGEYPYLKWKLEFADPNIQCVNNEAGKPPKKLGNILENTSLKPEAQFRLRDICEAIGLKWGDFDTDNIIGMEFRAKVGTDTYNSIISNKVERCIPARK